MRLYETTFRSANILRIAAGTTGLRGGDSGHGGRTVFEIEDLGNSDISVTPIEPDEFGAGNGGVIIELGGDTELETFCEALEWAAETLRRQMSRGANR